MKGETPRVKHVAESREAFGVQEEGDVGDIHGGGGGGVALVEDLALGDVWVGFDFPVLFAVPDLWCPRPCRPGRRTTVRALEVARKDIMLAMLLLLLPVVMFRIDIKDSCPAFCPPKLKGEEQQPRSQRPQEKEKGHP